MKNKTMFDHRVAILNTLGYQDSFKLNTNKSGKRI